MNFLNRILPWRRARIRRVHEALDPDLASDLRLYNSKNGFPFFCEGDVINARWKLVKVDGVLRSVPWGK
jgi:hypothetical protein